MPRLTAAAVMKANSRRSENRNRGLTRAIARPTKNSGTDKIANTIANAAAMQISLSAVLNN